MPKERLHSQTSETLRAIAKELETLAVSVRAVADVMDVSEVNEIRLTHHDSLTRGLHQISAFAQASREAVLQHQVDQGGLGRPIDDSGSEKSPRKPRTPKKVSE